MGIFNKKAIKSKFYKRSMRIGIKTLNLFIKNIESKLDKEIDKIVRNTIISGRKTIRKEDLILFGF